MAFNGMPDDCYFVPHTPLNDLQHIIDTQWANKEWCIALQDDIEKNGLASPLLVDNTKGDYQVRVGNNRAQALKYLGWTYVPCLIFGGPIPSEWKCEVVPTHNRAKEFFRDGTLDLRFYKFLLLDTSAPEHMTYPKTTNPYRDSSPTRR